MRIAKTTQEIKLYTEVNANFFPENLLPSELLAQKFVRDVVGNSLYDTILEHYTNNTLTIPEQQLFPFIQNVMVNFTMIFFCDAGQLEISNAGLQLNLSKERKTGFQWQILDLKKHYKRKAFSALESLLNFLYNSLSTDYPTWHNSDNKKKYCSDFFLDATQFSSFYNIHNDFAFFLQLKPHLVYAGDDCILPILGDALSEDIKTKILNNNLSSNEKILLKYIQKALAYKTIAIAIPQLISHLDEFGISENYFSSSQTINASEPARNEFVSLLLRDCDKKGDTYLYKLRSYLNNNAETFPLYTIKSNVNSISQNDRQGLFSVL